MNLHFFFKKPKPIKSIQNFKCTYEYCRGYNLLQFPLTENRIGWMKATQIDSSFLSSTWCQQLKGVGCAIGNLYSTPQPVSSLTRWAAVQRWERKENGRFKNVSKEEETTDLGAFQWLQAEEHGSRAAMQKTLFRKVQRKEKTQRLLLRWVWFS